MKKTAVILANLGSPTTISTRDIRLFLRDFLSDKRVVDLPRLLWLPILYCVILPFRPKALIKQYEQIWTDKGSPLIALTDSLAKKASNENYTVFSAMRYRTPSLDNVMSNIKNRGFKKIILLPLYPQYNGSTTGSLIDEAQRIVNKWKSQPQIECITKYYDHAAHIDAISQSIKTYWDKNGKSTVLQSNFGNTS